MLLVVEHLINLYYDMDSEHEDYNLDKLLEDLESNDSSNTAYKIFRACTAYKIFRACETDEEKLKAFITVNLNLPMYDKFDKYYVEVVGYNNNNNIPIAIIGITKESKINGISIWNTFSEGDVILAKNLDNFIGYMYVALYDIISAIENKNNPFVLDF